MKNQLLVNIILDRQPASHSAKTGNFLTYKGAVCLKPNIMLTRSK